MRPSFSYVSARFVTRRLISVWIVFGFHEVVFSSRSTISLVLTGAFCQTMRITSYSASDICGNGFMIVSPCSDGYKILRL